MNLHLGLIKCPTCEEYKGKVNARELNWENDSSYKSSDQQIGISCLCQGILCPKCGKNRIHRPVSNFFNSKSNTVEHWPYFTGMMGCRECREINNPRQSKHQAGNQTPAPSQEGTE